ncbi:MAG: hypothetical protein IID45_10885, partial [Planctomycetes bacterium]|nr:hypothetical protein [Planctomycetota bacterium]
MNFPFPKWWKQAVVAMAMLLLVGTSMTSLAAPKSSQRSANLRLQQSRQRDMQRAFAGKLAEIANFCQSKRLFREAALVRAMAKASAENKRFRFETLPRKVQSEIPRTLPEDERIWRIDLRKAQRDYANSLYALSRRALRAGFSSYAYQLIREVGRNNSDHIAARRLLGHVRNGDVWVTSYEKSKTDRGNVWHEKFGWLPKSHVQKSNEGQRYYRRRGAGRGRWIRADREATLRRNFRNAWQIRTEHYLVKTNHSLERGVEIARLLEGYYRYFFQTFAGFFNSREQMRKLFAGTATSGGRKRVKPYIVHYYRTKQEYIDKLKVKIPQIAITNGLYLTGTRIAYFFHTPLGNNNPTLYHEATHQIFYESLRRDRMIGERQHF